MAVADDPAWVWLSGRGARMTDHGFSPWRPNPGRLRHIGVVSELRLYLAQRLPDAGWVSERELFRDRPNRAVHVPDAVLELDSERHALEVELAPKARKRLVALIEELRASYDVVVYFCAPAPAHQIEELREERGERAKQKVKQAKQKLEQADSPDAKQKAKKKLKKAKEEEEEEAAC